MYLKSALACSLLFVTACSETQADETGGDNLLPTAAIVKVAEQSSPKSKTVAALYDRSCRTCHSLENSGAPLTGHKGAWKARLDEKGMEELITSTKDGYNAMPPMGLCNDCSDDDFKALILFMAGDEK